MPKDLTPSNPIPLGAVQVPVNGDPMDALADLENLTQKLLNMMAGSLQVATPTGAVLPYAGNAAPDGWLLCDGRAVSRTTYAPLFAVLGTRYGVGDGALTFNLPDLRGRAAIGAGQGTNLTNRGLGSTGGAETHALTTQELPAHSHVMATGYGSLGGQYELATTLEQKGLTSYDYAPAVPTGQTGGNAAHNNMPPFIALNHIIRL